MDAPQADTSVDQVRDPSPHVDASARRGRRLGVRDLAAGGCWIGSRFRRLSGWWRRCWCSC